MTRPRILLIDDTPANLLVLGRALEPEFELQIATSGAKGLALAAEAPPDLILLDIMMPEMDGYETCRRMKADARLRNVPIIFVTAMTEMEAEVTGLNLGAADYITKPVNVAIARQRIKNLLERERLRKAVEEAALQAAAQLTALKQQFLWNISHELRTPLNQIIGLAGLGARTRDLDKAQQLLARIEEAGRNFHGMIENILAFADAEAGLLPLDREPFDLASLLDELVRTWQARAEAKGLAFVASGIPTAPSLFHGDRARVAQLLEQLLSNAVKFTEQGTVTFSVRCDGEAFHFVVADQGIGMTPEQLDAAFHPFEQGDGGLTRRFGGIGLALSLVRHLVELMGGTLRVNSTPGVGTAFDIDLPLQPLTPPAPPTL